MEHNNHPVRSTKTVSMTCVQDAYFQLPEEKRLSLILRVGKASPDFFRRVLKHANITGYRPETASSWLKGPMLKRVEQSLDSKHDCANIPEIVRIFFTKTGNEIANAFFGRIADGLPTAAPAAADDCTEALAHVRQRYPSDSYLPLFESWLASSHTFEQPPAIPEELRSDLAALDKDLAILLVALSDLQQIGPCDVPVVSAALERANHLTTTLGDRFVNLVKASGEAQTTADWSTRVEFLKLWEKFGTSVAGLERQRKQSAEIAADITRLLATATVHHRFTNRQLELTSLAKEASQEIELHLDTFIPLLTNASSLPPRPQGQTHSPSEATDTPVATLSEAWLKWAWSLNGTSAEALLKDQLPLFPKFAQLLTTADWDAFRWEGKKTASTQAQGASPAPPKVDSPVAAVQPIRLVDAPPSPATCVVPPFPIAERDPKIAPLPDASLAAQSAQNNLEGVPATTAAPVPVAPPPVPQNPAPTKPSHAPPPPEQKPSTKVSVIPVTTATAPEKALASSPVVPHQAPAVIPSAKPSEVRQPKTVEDTIWDLGRQGRWGLASHLSLLKRDSSLPPAWAFEAAALGPRVSYEVSPLSLRLADLFFLSGDFSFETIPSTKQPAVRLLLAGAALRPALLAPQSNAASVLKLASLGETMRLSAFGALVEAAAEFGLHRQPLEPHMLRSTHNRADWEQQLARVREDIKAWVERAPKSHFSFAPALRIWLAWTGPNGALTNLLTRTAAASVADLAELVEAWAQWGDAPADQVQTAMKALGQWKVMDGVHRDKLIARLQDAIDLANRVLALLSQNPQDVTNFREENALLQLDIIRQNLQPSTTELQELAASAAEDMQAVVSLCMNSLAGIASLFTGGLPMPGGEEPKPCWLVDAELLRDPSVRFDTGGKVIPPTPNQQNGLLALAQSAPSWEDTWQNLLKAENHAATAAMLEVVRWQLPEGFDPVALAAQRDLELEACRKKLEKNADATRRLLDESASLGFCREKDYDDWSRAVTLVHQCIANATDFAHLNADLDRIRQEVQNQRNQETAKVRNRASKADLQPSILERIARLLDAGDIHTATDYIDRAASCQALPDDTTSNAVFNAFFADGGWLPQAELALREASLSDCWQAAGTGKAWNFLDFQSLGADQRAAAELHLKLWQKLERARSASVSDVLQLASALGLQPLKAVPRPGQTAPHTSQRYDIQTHPVDDRSTAVVPAFGSAAGGRYVLHLIWGEPRADELLSICRQEIGDTAGHIVVAFRILNRLERRELAEVARKPERLFQGIVVDRALFAFACAQTTARLSTLLRCALPFSCVEPYSSAAGEVPLEMFFGRGHELHSLAEPRGSCFVYGGRQLGKTALLRALERKFHNLSQGRAAAFVDLKRELFSRGRPLDDLWSVLVTRLKEIGVLGDIKIGAAAGQDALFRHIKDWLNASPERRLLLLLDEADSFLEQDGKESEKYEPFPRCQRLKGLWEDTGHRFKVVFAGLHNVQRSTRYSNHPLAHFGDAVCIGPMISEAEAREARALVEQPMTAAGYTFESADVVGRILALTNFYPSLIQIFCHHLLLDLRANHVVRFPNPRLTPPCVITSQHVQTVFGISVRKRILEKFQLTLDLDQRFELIAYLLAYYNSIQSGQDWVELREIRAEASVYWPAGFDEMRTDDEFRCLLDEMVGLGILRNLDSTSLYALRNENIVTLLGTQEEILRQLDSAKSWDLALKYESDKFRRLLSEKPRLLFSPLTAKQESELKASENRVAVLYGLAASGLSDVPAAMESDGAFGKSRTFILGPCPDAQTLSDRIASVERFPATNTVLVVPAGLPWDESWVAAASRRIQQFTSRDAYLTVLFVADPLRTIATLEGLDGVAEQGVRQFTLRPWHDAAVRQWLQDQGIKSDRVMRNRINEVTGNWPILLRRLNTGSVEALAHSCEDVAKLLDDPGQLQDLYSAFGFSKEMGEAVLRIAAELKKFTLGEVCEFADATDEAARQRVTLCIQRAQQLGLISIAAGGLEFDPVAAAILLNATKQA